MDFFFLFFDVFIVRYEVPARHGSRRFLSRSVIIIIIFIYYYYYSECFFYYDSSSGGAR